MFLPGSRREEKRYHLPFFDEQSTASDGFILTRFLSCNALLSSKVTLESSLLNYAPPEAVGFRNLFLLLLSPI